MGEPTSEALSVMTERFDAANHTISAVTLAGHPLAGWRYWRVYSIGTNDVVIETGAYDQPGPGLKNYAGYFVTRKTAIYRVEEVSTVYTGQTQRAATIQSP